MNGVLTFPLRAAAALAAAAAFAVPLLVVLHAEVPGTRQRPIFEPKPSDRLGPVEIGVDESPNHTSAIAVHRVALAVQDVAALTSHQRILLTIATFRTVPRLQRAELSFAGITCIYRTAEDIEIPDNRFVVFERDRACTAPAGHASGEATLVFRLRNRARVALVTFIGPTPAPRDALVLASPGVAAAHLTPILQGDVVDVYPESSARRIDLLAFMWDLRPDARWLDAAVAICGVLVGAAVLAAWPTQRGSRFAAARLAFAAFLAAFALAACYAVLCPPFQVADEPSHFLVITEYLGRPDLGTQSEAWARRNMFEEIRFSSRRPFSPLDREHTGRKWSEVSVPGRDLYGAGRALWRLLAPFASRMNLPQFFLTVRLFHAVGFALAAALFVLLVRSATGSTAAIGAAMPLFLVPALPQFAMHVSNYAPLLAAYIVLAAGVAIVAYDDRRSWAAGAVIGVALGAAISMSRSSLPLLPLIASVLAVRVCLGDRDRRPGAAWAFWGGLTLLLAGMLMFIHMSYTTELDIYGGLVAPTATAFTVLLRQPVLVLPFGAAGLMSEILFARARRHVRYRPHPAVVRGIAYGAAIALFVLLAASLLMTYPALPLYLPRQRPSAAEYVREAVLACVTFLRFGHPDWLTSVTFFAGFGWLDMEPPTRLVSFVAGLSGMMLVLLLVWAARARSTRTLIFLAFAAAGFVASTAAYALSIVRAVPSDLHGRYLLGLYVCALAVCWTGIGRVADSPSSPRGLPIAAAALACCIAVHVYSLKLILVRYFA